MIPRRLPPRKNCPRWPEVYLDLILSVIRHFLCSCKLILQDGLIRVWSLTSHAVAVTMTILVLFFLSKHCRVKLLPEVAGPVHWNSVVVSSVLVITSLNNQLARVCFHNKVASLHCVAHRWHNRLWLSSIKIESVPCGQGTTCNIVARLLRSSQKRELGNKLLIHFPT